MLGAKVCATSPNLRFLLLLLWSEAWPFGTDEIYYTVAAVYILLLFHFIYSNSKYFFGVNYKTNINWSKHSFKNNLSLKLNELKENDSILGSSINKW